MALAHEGEEELVGVGIDGDAAGGDAPGGWGGNLHDDQIFVGRE